ncbi:helix-turn-helix transcriptional regulator [Latilactobacillus graminis]|uniref:HTH cro/C1-type domain-containing protein n=1 Tax=Latilactobacillus graminis DSM 20719 TaxID=1423752 RepID=A0AA89L476_9LACO|nr:helix-turn-helix transcriptional regulator [Latilactobacillus graminis]KRM22690.1 hypothetical protein FC90_GL000790 [Latilactobacillus graminis DSM 20719]
MSELIIDQYLKKRGLTRSDAARLSGINKQTLSVANRNSNVSSWSVKTVQALAMATGQTAGETLDELLHIEGNPIIRFIQEHPFLKKELVTEIEDLLIKAHEADINLKTVTFNCYYTENEDTNENATRALINLKDQLERFISDQYSEV